MTMADYHFIVILPSRIFVERFHWLSNPMSHNTFLDINRQQALRPVTSCKFFILKKLPGCFDPGFPTLLLRCQIFKHLGPYNTSGSFFLLHEHWNINIWKIILLWKWFNSIVSHIHNLTFTINFETTFIIHGVARGEPAAECCFFQIGLFFWDAFRGGLYTSTWNFGITRNKAQHYRLQPNS